MYRIFDIIIFSLLLGSPVLAGLLFRRLRHGTSFFLILLWAIIFYGSFLEPRMLRVERQTILLTDSPTTELRVALISDLHLGPFKGSDFVTRIVEKIALEKPDVILFAGDFILEEADDSALAHLEPLKNLAKAPLGTFAVLGNHDYGHEGEGYLFPYEKRAAKIETKLTELGIEVLRNKTRVFTKAKAHLTLIGVDEYWSSHASIGGSLSHLRADLQHPHIVLTHNADIVKAASSKYSSELVLAGHTHGGQIRLPLIGPVPEIPHTIGRKYDRGLFDYDGTQLFITSGAGETGTRARLFVPPEIALLTIKF